MFNFSFRSKGLEELQAYLKEFPRGARGKAAEAFADDLIGDGQRGLKHYPAYRHVTRRSAFGKPFVSDRQRKYVMAAIREGRIEPGYPHRTGNFQRSIQREGSGVNSRIVADLPHEGWPNRLAKKVGWRDLYDVIMSNVTHAANAAERRVQEWIKSKGMG
jgi:hypothetical protein